MLTGRPDRSRVARGVCVTVLMWILGGAGLWAVAAAVLSLVMGRLIGQAQSERDSYDELRANRPMPTSRAVDVQPANAPPVSTQPVSTRPVSAQPVQAQPVTAAELVRTEPETAPIPLATPRQQAAPSFEPFVRPRIPQPRPQPHIPCASERSAPRG